MLNAKATILLHQPFNLTVCVWISTNDVIRERYRIRYVLYRDTVTVLAFHAVSVL